MDAKKVVVFDLDGTLARANTFHMWLAFLVFEGESELPTRKRVQVATYALQRALRLISHRQLKSRILELVAGEASCRMVARFVEKRVVPRLSSSCVAELARWKEAGSTIVLATAAPALYAGEIGKRVGCDVVLATEWTYTKSFRECIGIEKARRVRELVGEPSILAVYTDHPDDLPLLAGANEKYLVNPSAQTVAELGSRPEMADLRIVRD